MRKLLIILGAVAALSGLLLLGAAATHVGVAPAKLTWTPPEFRSALMTFAYKVYGNPKMEDGRHYLSKITFKNAGQRPITDFSISYKLQDYIPWTDPETMPEIPAGFSFAKLYYPRLPADVTKLRTPTTCALQVKVQWKEDGQAKSETFRHDVLLRSVNELTYCDLPASEVESWFDAFDTSDFAVAMVTPSDPVVAAYASEITKLAGGTVAGVTGGPKEIYRLCGAAYEYMCRTGLRYTGDNGVPANYDDVKTFAQAVRLPRDVIQNNNGLCVELAILWASVLKHLNVEAALVMVPGHCYVVAYSPSMGLPLGEGIPIECTAITPQAVDSKTPVSFDNAVKMAVDETKRHEEDGRILFLPVSDYEQMGFTPARTARRGHGPDHRPAGTAPGPRRPAGTGSEQQRPAGRPAGRRRRGGSRPGPAAGAVARAPAARPSDDQLDASRRLREHRLPGQLHLGKAAGESRQRAAARGRRPGVDDRVRRVPGGRHRKSGRGLAVCRAVLREAQHPPPAGHQQGRRPGHGVLQRHHQQPRGHAAVDRGGQASAQRGALRVGRHGPDGLEDPEQQRPGPDEQRAFPMKSLFLFSRRLRRTAAPWLAGAACVLGLVASVRGQAVPKTADINEDVSPDGSVNLGFQMTFDAAPWRQWKTMVGDEPARLRAMMRHRFAAMTIENFKLERDDMNRVASMTMHSPVGPELRDDGTFQVPVDGYFRLVNNAGRVWYFSGNNPQAGNTLNNVKVTLPANAVNASLANPNSPDQALVFALTPPSSASRGYSLAGGGLLLLGLGLLAAGFLQRRAASVWTPALPRALPTTPTRAEAAPLQPTPSPGVEPARTMPSTAPPPFVVPHESPGHGVVYNEPD